MTTITLTKTIDRKGLGYSFGTETGSTPVTITACIQEVAWDTKKTLIKTPFMKDWSGSTSGDIDFYYVDLKNIEEGVRIRGWLDDSIESTGTVTSSGNSSLTDTNKTWIASQWVNYYVRVTKSGKDELKKITANTSDTLTIDGAWTSNPSAGNPYEIIYPAWMKFWQLRAMSTTGGRLSSFVFADITFDGTHTMGGDPWVPPGATLEEVGMTISTDDTGAIQIPLSDVARINITMTLVIGDDIRNAT